MKNLLHHLFIPHHRNNHRAKLLHNSSISIMLIALLFLNFFASFLKYTTPDVLGISYNITENELLILTNKMRSNNNLPPLVLNEKLKNAASEKAKDMFVKNYWAHFGPDGTTPWQFIRGSEYSYIYAGENLAKGFTTSDDVVNAWMNSPTHKENILSNKYNDIGFAIVEGTLLGENTVLIVQIFGATEAPPNNTGPQIVTNANMQPAQSTPTPTPHILIANIKSDQEKKQIPTPTIIQQSNKPLISSALGKVNGNTVQMNAVHKRPFLDSLLFSKSLLLLIFPIIMMTFLVDFIIVERKKIPRLVGHNIDHFMLFFLFILYIIIQSGGVII